MENIGLTEDEISSKLKKMLDKEEINSDTIAKAITKIMIENNKKISSDMEECFKFIDEYKKKVRNIPKRITGI